MLTNLGVGEPERERVAVGECALALLARDDRRRQQFGQRLQPRAAESVSTRPCIFSIGNPEGNIQGDAQITLAPVARRLQRRAAARGAGPGPEERPLGGRHRRHRRRH